jgi:hypothetical protein
LDRSDASRRIWHLTYDGCAGSNAASDAQRDTRAIGAPVTSNGWWRDRPQLLLVLKQDNRRRAADDRPDVEE